MKCLVCESEARPFSNYCAAHTAKDLVTQHELIKSLENILDGMSLAYDSASKKFIDETLLHIGHHQAKLAKLLEKLKQA